MYNIYTHIFLCTHINTNLTLILYLDTILLDSVRERKQLFYNIEYFFSLFEVIRILKVWKISIILHRFHVTKKTQ